MESKIEYYGKEDSGYPQRLRVLPGSPGGLYVKGGLPPADRPAVAVVGARICSEYGRSQAFAYARALAERGVTVISGLARGIDAAAHRGALAGGGKTYAVLGSGVDNCYPKMNFPLYCEILESGGGILSEFPPGARPDAWHFPVRNRIISGLSDAVLVIEARKRSGSLITADCALEQGKTVLALPGRVGDSLSEGCNWLIYQGAVPAYAPEAVLGELGGMESADFGHNEPASVQAEFSGDERLVYDSLELMPKGLGILAAETGLSTQVLSGILLALQREGWADEAPRNYWRRYQRRCAGTGGC